MEKLERDGMVGVLVSRGFGAGWSSWSTENSSTLAMDKDIVQAVLDGDIEKAISIAKQKCGDFYAGGADDLVVEWLKSGTVFEINEYDGSESIHVIGGRDYLVA